eukprot:4609143-Pleurochrysis_carterae.AAC.2
MKEDAWAVGRSVELREGTRGEGPRNEAGKGKKRARAKKPQRFILGGAGNGRQVRRQDETDSGEQDGAV